MKIIQYMLVSASCFSSLLATEDLVEKRFTEIYEKNLWGTENKSGEGSLIEKCSTYVQYLQRFIQENNIRSVLDLGCGDFSFSKYIDWAGVQYTGVDIVKQNVENNTILYGSDNIKFIHGNIVTMDLPEADLVICKHVLQHLPNEAVTLFLKKLNKYRFCLLTDQIESDMPANLFLPLGKSRPLNLLLPPFNLPAEKVCGFNIGGYQHQVLLLKRSQ